jgi:hypothetical protein
MQLPSETMPDFRTVTFRCGVTKEYFTAFFGREPDTGSFVFYNVFKATEQSHFSGGDLSDDSLQKHDLSQFFDKGWFCPCCDFQKYHNPAKYEYFYCRACATLICGGAIDYNTDPPLLCCPCGASRPLR